MRMTPRVAGAFGRVGFRATSPRIAPHPPMPPGEGDFSFPGYITDQAYRITPEHGHIIIIGFFGRAQHDGNGKFGNIKLSATYNGRPMQINCSSYAGQQYGMPGFVWIEGVEPGVEGEVVFSSETGNIHTGAMRFMDPPNYAPIARPQPTAWMGNGGSGIGMQMTPQNDGREQILHVGGYGGNRSPIRVTNEPNFYPDRVCEWVKERYETRVQSSIVAGSETTVVFTQIQTTENSLLMSQRPNQFKLEEGYGLAYFCAKDMGLTPP